MNVLRYLWFRRTTTFGYLQVILGVLVTATWAFSPTTLKWIILCNAMLTALLGHYNNRGREKGG